MCEERCIHPVKDIGLFTVLGCNEAMPYVINMLFSCSVTSNSCNPMDCSLPGSSVHRIFQTRILEWVAMFSSRL